MMTDAELARMAELEAKATKGPWEWSGFGGGDLSLMTPTHGRLVVLDCVRKGFNGATFRVSNRCSPTAGGIMFEPTRGGAAAHPDTAFIAASRTFVPDAIQEIKRLREELENRPVRYIDGSVKQ